MKRLFILFFALSTMTLMAQTPINIIVGSKSFTATLADSETDEAFAALMPLSVTMNELNSNEKYHYLSSSLPTAAYQPGTIHAGDLMLYGNNCVVLFYETFITSYSYTRLSADTSESFAAPLLSGYARYTSARFLDRPSVLAQLTTEDIFITLKSAFLHDFCK